MGAGLGLVVLGALLAFAVEDDMPGIRLSVAGVILMVAGAAVIWHARATASKEKVVRREESEDPATHSHVIQETVRQRRME